MVLVSVSSQVVSKDPPSASAQVVSRPNVMKCKKRKGSCNHEVVFDNHYNEAAWKKYADYVNSLKSMTVIDED